MTVRRESAKPRRETSARRPGDWLRRLRWCLYADPQTGTGAKKKDACPQPYGEGPRGEPAGRRLVTAAYPPLQQRIHESCGPAAYPPESRDYFPMRTAYLSVNVATQWRLRVNDTGVGLPADFEVKRGDSL